jgi:hypothetical protein
MTALADTIEEVYLETNYGDEQEARQARDQRIEQLQAQGWICIAKTLYTVWGKCVFYLEATSPDAKLVASDVDLELDNGRSPHPTKPSDKRSIRPRKRDATPSYEVR